MASAHDLTGNRKLTVSISEREHAGQSKLLDLVQRILSALKGIWAALLDACVLEGENVLSCCRQLLLLVLVLADLISWTMDPFDDFLPELPVARARAGGKFIPKAKSKQLPRKEIYASEHATSCDDENDELFVSSSTSTKTVGLLQVECSNAVASDKEFVKSNHHSPIEVPNLDYDVNPELGNFPEVNLNHDGAIMLDTLPSTILSSKVNGDWDSNFSKSANEADPEGNCVSSVANIICTVNHSDEDPSKNEEVLILDGNKNLEFLDTSLQAGEDVGSKSASNYKVAMSVGNTISNSSIARAVEVDSMELELDPFVDIVPEAGARNASKFQPKIKPRPRVGTAAAGASPSPDVTMEKSVKLPTSFLNKVQSSSISNDGLAKPTNNFSYACSSIPLSEDSRSLEETIPSQPISPNALLSEIANQNNARDWPSSFGKSSGETADIFSGLECLDDFLTQAVTGADRTFGTPVHEEQANAADSPTFGDLLHVDDVPGENIDASEIKKDATMPSFPRNHKGGEPLRQLRKRANRKPVDENKDEDVDSADDLDPSYNCNIGDLEDNDDAVGVDCSSKKRKASTNSKKKSVAKNGDQSQKRKKANEDSEGSTKEPPKKFSHSTRRRKRCVDKALLETPEDELDHRTLRIKDIILLAEHRERLAKKEAATIKTSSNDQSGGDSLHETDAHDQEEILGSEDERASDDDQASERVPVAPSLFNYQSFMDKAPNGKWSKQDTELFYEAVRQFGTDFSMIQQLFPGRTRHQVKLKYKKEERQHPLRLSEAVNNRAKDHSHFKSVIERLRQASAKAEEDHIDGSVGITSVEDLMIETDEVARPQQETVVKDQEDAALHSPEKSDDSDNDLDMWCQYKSDY